MKMDTKVSVSGSLRPLMPHQGLCLWTPLAEPLDPAGGSAPDPHLGSQILDPPLLELHYFPLLLQITVYRIKGRLMHDIADEIIKKLLKCKYHYFSIHIVLKVNLT